MKLFGLRISRIPAFIRCVRLATGTPGAFSALFHGAKLVLFHRSNLPTPFFARRRLRICRKCPFFDRNFNRCTACGCYIPYKVASEPLGARCPINIMDPSNGWD